ncbi:MAG: dCTP deaminase [Thermoplasmata archaeon]|nr:MAG: dCTP deaminase [Thermoplasmatales archaeon ex4484_6]RLF60844.1 MAG: dCTP deaminase [Thermoplasmata archaeon]RLF66621.1 MAG: dCTP deaminase [Thermoplasmata archaeon]
MSILTDQDIVHRLEKGTMKIDPFRERNLTPNGYDLTVKEVYFRAPEGKVTIGSAYLEPGEWCLVSTEEYLEVPHDLCATLWMRSSFVRMGLIAGFGLVDAGFKGTLTFSVSNPGPVRVALPVGERICQICYQKLESTPQKLYEERSGTYQGQSGVTLDGGKKV